MNILPNGQINHELTLVDILFGKRINNVPASNKTLSCRRDTIVISDEARDMAVPKTSGGRAYNTRIDSTIDLQGYVDAARKTNQEVIENAGTEIDPSPAGYVDVSAAFRAALTDKYSRLVEEALRIPSRQPTK